ncbi:ArsR family transcriptional regulator [Halobacteria archaeon AArc-dxtr1]|nr:ArsR family transcriptional regulator [Halobacteria archaeon AArc-dxtr1]
MVDQTAASRAFKVLDHRSRRRILWTVASKTNEIDVTVLRTKLGNANGRTVALRHTHLPKLEDSGYLIWNREAGTVERGPQWEEITPMLELFEEHAEELPYDWR